VWLSAPPNTVANPANTGGDTGRVLFLYTPARAGGFFEERLGRPAGSIKGVNEIRRRHGREIVGPPPF
jgi:hypothetical protein